MNDQLIALRGVEASQILEAEAFKLAMQSIRETVQAQLEDCPIRDREGMVLLLQLTKLVKKFEATLTGMVESGNYARRKIELDKLRDESAPRQFMRRVSGQ